MMAARVARQVYPYEQMRDQFGLLHRLLTKRLEQKQRVYLTGHSLGGGLAMLVSLTLNNDAVGVVTVNSPGTFVTAGLLGRVDPFGQQKDHDLQVMKSVNVQANNDLVSKVDTAVGETLPLVCRDKNYMSCHMLGDAICEIITACGDVQNRTLRFSPFEGQCASTHYKWVSDAGDP